MKTFWVPNIEIKAVTLLVDRLLSQESPPHIRSVCVLFFRREAGRPALTRCRRSRRRLRPRPSAATGSRRHPRQPSRTGPPLLQPRRPAPSGPGPSLRRQNDAECPPPPRRRRPCWRPRPSLPRRRRCRRRRSRRSCRSRW